MKSARGPVLSDPERSRTRAEGFTLVELLVVISIIAILSIIGLTIFTGVQKSARDAKRRGDINALTKALEIYKSEKGDYPPEESDTGGSDACVSNFAALQRLVPNYIQSIPEDPIFSMGNPDTNYCYWYRKGPGDSVFTIYARLEADSSQVGSCTGKLYRLEISKFNFCRTQQQ